ncbi:hypothetical protein BH24ACT5_BH24ACT5_00110 [soil metagenome]
MTQPSDVSSHGSSSSGLRTGIVGVGKMGISHLAIATDSPQLDVVGVCDSQGFLVSTISTNTGAVGYTNVEKMFDEAQLDCVFISTPTSSHFDLGLLAIDRGIHAFIEKPLTLSYDQSSELARRAVERGVANQVGYHNRFIGTFREAARLVCAGAIGEIHHVDGEAYGQVVTKDSGRGWTWRSKKSEGGGCLHDYACHVIDLMNFVVGRPADVIGSRLSSVFSAQVEDCVNALFTYPNGASGVLQTNWSDTTYRKMTTNITVYGSLGKIVADRQECRVYLRDGVSFEEYQPGWTIRYITELQDPVAFYLRGEEYSSQIDAFALASSTGRSDAENSFASAADADWVVNRIIEVHDAGPPVFDAQTARDRASERSLGTQVDRVVSAFTRSTKRSAGRVAAGWQRLRDRSA